jgi:hypothetical protein
VAEHEEPDGLHAELAGRAEVLDRDVGLGAVRRDAGHRGADRVRLLELVHGARPGSMRIAILARSASSTAALMSSNSSTLEKP